MPKIYYVELGRFLSTIFLLILENTHTSIHNRYSMLFPKPKQLVKIDFVKLKEDNRLKKYLSKSPSITLLRLAYSFQT